jgi:hypothetical protein
MQSQFPEIPNFDFRHQTVVLTPTPAQILTANVRRVGVYFSHISTLNEVVLAPHVIDGFDQGFMIPSLQLPLIFRWPDDGILPMLEWWGIGNAAAEDVYVLELLYNPPRKE